MNECEPKKYWSNQVPAPETKERLKEGDKKFEFIEISMVKMNGKIDKLVLSVETNNTLNQVQHKEILDRLGNIETWAVRFLIGCGIVLAYFVLNSIGVPVKL